jgi:pyoverdine/dityrosine biosynthesis protein Dit1
MAMMSDSLDHRIRRRLLESAARLLAYRGLAADLLQLVSRDAGCSPEQTRVFFRRDEELVLALYTRFATELEAAVPELPADTIAARFHAIMQAKFAILTPYREALAALMATALDPRHELGALSSQTELVRLRVQGVFDAVIQGGVDAPQTPSPSLSRALYGVHLALMLLWCQDQSVERDSARAALELARDLIALVVPFASIPEAAAISERFDKVFQPLLERADDPAVDAKAIAILQRIFNHRRLLPQSEPCASAPCSHCLALHLPKVKYFIRAGQPIHCVLPAFPAKSPSRRKTLGPMPDMAEEQALLFLQSICGELHELHPPGLRVTICSDGHVFADLVGVGDEDVSHYGAEMAAFVRRLGCRSIDLFSMSDLYDGIDFAPARQHLTREYARSLDDVRDRIHRFPPAQAQFNGMHRFLFEEQSDVQPGRSRTQLREACKDLAYEVIRRSDAWGRLVADCFPAALRLSIHPQHPHSEKIGILLGRAADVWQTPWHGVAARDATGWKFMKRYEAEDAGARLVERDGRPSHFELPG